MQKKSLLEFFKDSWQLFSKGYRKVFKYLWWYFQKVRAVFPSLETIAKDIKMSKRQVQNALKYFCSVGLIGWVKRPYQSNVYFMPNEIIKIDLKDERSLNAHSEINCHQDCHVLPVVSSSVLNISCTSKSPSAPVPKSLEKKEQKDKEERKKWYFSLPISLQLRFMWDAFDFKRFGWAIKALSEHQIYEILNDFTWYRRTHTIEKPERFITQRALAMLRGK